MEILEDENKRVSLCKRLEEFPPGGESIAATVAAAALHAQSDERPQMLRDPLGLVLSGDGIGDHRVELRLGLLQWIGLEDARLRFHDLAQRPVREALAVRE